MSKRLDGEQELDDGQSDQEEEYKEEYEEESEVSKIIEKLGNPLPFQLIVNFNRESLDELVFDQDLVKIGRGANCDVVIDNLGASRVHAEIERIGKFYLLRDMDSQNGYLYTRRKNRRVLLEFQVMKFF